MTYTPGHIPDLKGILNSFVRVAYETTEKAVGKFSESERQKFVKRIERQDFHSFKVYPLSEAYFQRKRRKKLDLRTHIATYNMVRNIKLFRVKKDTRHHLYHVGFERTAMAIDEDRKPLPLPLHRLAMILEKGSLSNNLPPRPTWKPHLEDMKIGAEVLRRRLPREIAREARRRDRRLRSVLYVR